MVTLVRPYKKIEVNTSGFPSLTSIYDVGRKIDKIVTSSKHYTMYERCVVSSASNFLIGLNRSVKLRAKENCKTALSDNRKLEGKFKLDAVLLKKIPENDECLSPLELTDVLRLITRECMWAQLFSNKKIVHFSWDTYVYFAGGKLSKAYVDEYCSIGRVVNKVHRFPTIDSI